MYTNIFFSIFLNILKYDFGAVGASTPVSQSGYPLDSMFVWIKIPEHTFDSSNEENS
jgi:hypothetical protein